MNTDTNNARIERIKRMSEALLSNSELRECIHHLLVRFEESAADFPMIFVPGRGGPTTSAAALRSIVTTATLHQLGEIRRQLGEHEGVLIRTEQRDAESRDADARRDTLRYSPPSDDEQRETETLFRESREAHERMTSDSSRLERIEKHLETIATALAKR